MNKNVFLLLAKFIIIFIRYIDRITELEALVARQPSGGVSVPKTAPLDEDRRHTMEVQRQLQESQRLVFDLQRELQDVQRQGLELQKKVHEKDQSLREMQEKVVYRLKSGNPQRKSSETKFRMIFFVDFLILIYL